ncbi:hypothetical protein G6O42_24785, partial [Salmonella enterica subsp. enterica serovar Enteritidis]|nr:hypothetical protein [Salmonella enterica subsp. enterica serovar Enteritidis]
AIGPAAVLDDLAHYSHRNLAALAGRLEMRVDQIDQIGIGQPICMRHDAADRWQIHVGRHRGHWRKAKRKKAPDKDDTHPLSPTFGHADAAPLVRSSPSHR